MDQYNSDFNERKKRKGSKEVELEKTSWNVCLLTNFNNKIIGKENVCFDVYQLYCLIFMFKTFITLNTEIKIHNFI